MFAAAQSRSGAARSHRRRGSKTGVGGRFLEVYDEAGEDFFEIGKILVWEPGKRLVFEWRGLNFDPGQVTEVELNFSPQGEGTCVTLEHRGWASLPQEHPVRHGLADDA